MLYNFVKFPSSRSLETIYVFKIRLTFKFSTDRKSFDKLVESILIIEAVDWLKIKTTKKICILRKLFSENVTYTQLTFVSIIDDEQKMDFYYRNDLVIRTKLFSERFKINQVLLLFYCLF